MKNHLRSHTWMHVGLLAVITIVFGLNLVGFTVPAVVTYLIVLACPLMMVLMMAGMGRGYEVGGDEAQGVADTGARGRPSDDVLER